MSKSTKKQAEPIKDFSNIADYKAATAKEGDIDTPIFDGIKVRRIIHNGEAFYSVVDVVGILSESSSPRDYWAQTKKRLLDEAGGEPLTNCQQLKLPAQDGKMRETDCANIKTLLRIVQSVPSKKAEPFKRWLAEIGFERIQETAEPDRAIERGIEGYRKKSYDDAWTGDRVKNISAYNEKTFNWGNRGVDDSKDFAQLNAEMTKKTFGVTPKKYAEIKGVAPAKRKDHMTRIELQLDTLADTAAVEIMTTRDTKKFDDTRKASLDGAGVAAAARKALEKQTGKPVVTKENALPKKSDPDKLPEK
jgi:DNA-damage-inducible protein D